MTDPAEIDRLPVGLTKAQQKEWDHGDRRVVRKQVREERLAVQIPVEDMTPAPSFDEVIGDG